MDLRPGLGRPHPSRGAAYHVIGETEARLAEADALAVVLHRRPLRGPPDRLAGKDDAAVAVLAAPR